MDQKHECGRWEPAHNSLIEGLWEQYAPGAGNILQISGEKFWRSWNVRGGRSGFAGTGPAHPQLHPLQNPFHVYSGEGAKTTNPQSLITVSNNSQLHLSAALDFDVLLASQKYA